MSYSLFRIMATYLPALSFPDNIHNSQCFLGSCPVRVHGIDLGCHQSISAPACMQVRGVYGVLLESKADRWQAQRGALIESIQNLAAFYKALQALPRSTSTADLSEWFEHLIEQVSYHRAAPERRAICTPNFGAHPYAHQGVAPDRLSKKGCRQLALA